jgi:hypothetical protein
LPRKYKSKDGPLTLRLAVQRARGGVYYFDGEMRLDLAQSLSFQGLPNMLTVARAVLSRLVNAMAFVIIVAGGVAAGCALNIAEEVESEIKKRTAAHRTNPRR